VGHEIWWADHSVEALEDSVVFEVSTPHLDDVVRLSDRYGRTSED
jgi:mannose-6-phosphate isomerase